MADSIVRNSKEVWKDIQCYEGLYQVSSHGNIRSLDRVVSNGPKSTRKIKGRLIKPYLNNSGYLKVSLWKDNKGKKEFIHRIELKAFKGIPEKGFDHANHIDGDKLNNMLWNLEWTSRSENMAHASDNNLLQKGSDAHNSKLTESDVYKIREMYATGDHTQREIAELFDIHQVHVSDIVLKKRWSYL